MDLLRENGYQLVNEKDHTKDSPLPSLSTNIWFQRVSAKLTLTAVFQPSTSIELMVEHVKQEIKQLITIKYCGRIVTCMVRPLSALARVIRNVTRCSPRTLTLVSTCS